MVDLQQFDLSLYHFIASVLGVVLSLWLIKLSTHNRVHAKDKMCLKWVARLSYALIGISLGWSASFAIEQNWQPWPPFLVLCLAIDVRMIASVIGAYVQEA